MKSLAVLGVAFVLVACGTEGPSREEAGATVASSGSGATTGSGGSTTSSSVGGSSANTRDTVSGDVTWTVTFDATAKAAGATDCTYTRHYEGVQDQSAPWLCPECEVTFLADVQVTAGLQDCYGQVSTTPPSATEWIGYGNGVYYRGAGGPMGEQGTAMIAAPTMTVANTVMDLPAPVGGTLAFAVAGQFTLAQEDGDPLHGFVPPASYACGWPKADPAPYTGDYTLAMGATLPDGLFKDSCEETVRLHDFAGDYLLIDMAAMDCPPCQNMASQEEQFIATMAQQGITVHVITLMAPSLADPIGETTKAMLDSWKNQFSLMSPVLADRVWGLSMFYPLFTDMTGYPSWVLVAPDLTVFDWGTGFGTFTDFQTAITTHKGQ